MMVRRQQGRGWRTESITVQALLPILECPWPGKQIPGAAAEDSVCFLSPAYPSDIQPAHTTSFLLNCIKSIFSTIAIASPVPLTPGEASVVRQVVHAMLQATEPDGQIPRPAASSMP